MSSDFPGLPPGLRGVRLRGAGDEQTARPATPAPERPRRSRPASRSSVPLLDVKAVQRRAYERGREVEREEAGALLQRAVEELRSTAAMLEAARRREAAEVAEFAVELACSMAEELVGRVMAEDRHHVRDMVKQVLEAALPDMEAGTASLRGHPDDVGRLGRHFGEGPPVRLVPDRNLERGTFLVEAGEVEFHASVRERLAAMREHLVSEKGWADDS